MPLLGALVLIAAFVSFVWAAIKRDVRWVAVGLALTILVPALHALASIV